MAHPIYEDLDLQGSARILGLPTPAAADEAATKAYVDANSGGASANLLQNLFAAVALTNYTGLAASGALTSDETWTIRRTIFNTDGSVDSTAIATNVAWDDRLTATYT